MALTTPIKGHKTADGDLTANKFISTVATGTAPLTITSTTLVTNLNADLLDGIDSSKFLRSDVADTKTSGDLTFNNNVSILFGTTPTMAIKSSGVTNRINLISGDLTIQKSGVNTHIFHRDTGNFTATGSGTFGGQLTVQDGSFRKLFIFDENSALTFKSIAPDNNDFLRPINITASTINIRTGGTGGTTSAVTATFESNGNFTATGTGIFQGTGDSSFVGSAGFGTTTPNKKVEIVDSNTYQLQLRSNSNADNTKTGIRFISSTSSSSTFEVSIIAERTNLGLLGVSDLYFNTYGTDGFQERLRIFGSGDVGIGISTSIDHKLHLRGGNLLLELDTTSSTGEPTLSFKQNGVLRGNIIQKDSNDDMWLTTFYGGMKFYTGTAGSADLAMQLYSNNDCDINGVVTAIDGLRKTITDDASTSHTVGTSDASVVRRFTSSSSITVTVNTGSLTNIGETAEIDQSGTGLVTIAAGTATLRVNAAVSLVSSGQYSRISIQKMTSTEYRVFGELA